MLYICNIRKDKYDSSLLCLIILCDTDSNCMNGRAIKIPLHQRMQILVGHENINTTLRCDGSRSLHGWTEQMVRTRSSPYTCKC